MKSRLVMLALAAVLLLSARYLSADPGSAPVAPELAEYVKKPEAAYSWKVDSKNKVADNEIITLSMVSQVWQGITWDHKIQIFIPKDVSPTKTLLLWNTGGEPRPGDQMMGMAIARLAKAPVAFLYGVPKQPLFGGKKEDALIAETYVRFLESKDATWPLLFPMAKSVVKAMDALQEYTKQEWPAPVENFVISGASKRGWTTWLAAASGDKRIKAIAPVVIDTLNMAKQLPHQLEMFGGKYSEQIHDYVERGLAPMPDTPEARKLLAMVDPYSYRSVLTLPKLLVNGANDPYWAVDALNNYWDGLQGPKWVVYVPNAGHNLQQDKGNGTKDSTTALNTLAAFYRHQLTDKPLPKLAWELKEDGGAKTIAVKSDPKPKSITCWKAEHGSLDFRPAKWEALPMSEPKEPTADTLNFTVAKNGKHQAFFIACEYEVDGITYPLCTQIQVVRAK